MPAKREVCGERGCGKGPADGVTLYDVGHGPRCAKHFTGKAAATKEKKGRAP